jgi:hypothetical protein
MRAIHTKYLPPTHTKPSRCKAYDSSGQSLTVSVDSYSNYEQASNGAAVKFAQSRGWTGTLVKGGTKEGNVYVFDFPQDRIAL